MWVCGKNSIPLKSYIFEVQNIFLFYISLPISGVLPNFFLESIDYNKAR